MNRHLRNPALTRLGDTLFHSSLAVPPARPSTPASLSPSFQQFRSTLRVPCPFRPDHIWAEDKWTLLTSPALCVSWRTITKDAVKRYSCLKQVTFRSQICFLNLIIRGNQAGIKRVIHWTLEGKKKTTKNKLTSIKCFTTQHSKALYVLLHHHQETSMSSTDNTTRKINGLHLEDGMNEPLLNSCYTLTTTSGQAGDLPAPLPACTAFACYTTALRRWDERSSSTRHAPRFWGSPAGQGLTLTRRRTLRGRPSCSLRLPQRVLR